MYWLIFHYLITTYDVRKNNGHFMIILIFEAAFVGYIEAKKKKKKTSTFVVIRDHSYKY